MVLKFLYLKWGSLKYEEMCMLWIWPKLELKVKYKRLHFISIFKRTRVTRIPDRRFTHYFVSSLAVKKDYSRLKKFRIKKPFSPTHTNITRPKGKNHTLPYIFRRTPPRPHIPDSGRMVNRNVFTFNNFQERSKHAIPLLDAN